MCNYCESYRFQSGDVATLRDGSRVTIMASLAPRFPSTPRRYRVRLFASRRVRTLIACDVLAPADYTAWQSRLAADNKES